MRRLSFLQEQLPQQQQQQQQQNQRRPARRRTTVTNIIDADGLLGSLRRFSLESPMDHDQDNTSDYNAVSDYQEVFHQLKLENPTASIGALQHKTMERIAELKALRKEEERRQRLEWERKEEEERIRNQSAAEKYVNRLVGKIRLPMMDQQHHHDSNPNMTKNSHHNNHRISPQDYNENVATTTTTTTTDNHNHRTSFIAVPTGARVSMIANPTSSTNTARRASSALIDIPWTNNARRRSSAESSSKSNDGNTNLAPRRGFVVLDMIHGGVDDGGGVGGGGGGGSNRSVLSYHSNGSGIFSIANSDLDGSSSSEMSGMSGLYIDEDNVPSTLCSSPEAERKRQKYSPSVAAGGGDGRVEDALTRMLVSYLSSSGGDIDHDQTFPPAADGVLIHKMNDELSPRSPTRRHLMPPQFASSTTDGNDDVGKDSKSESSLSTTDFSRRSSDGLIVGFGDRCRRNDDVGDGEAAEEDVDDDLIVGFVDRHTKVR